MTSRSRTRPSRAVEGPTLLEAAAKRGKFEHLSAPLADRMRPCSLEEMVGQPELLSPGKLLYQAIESDHLPSLILWGPPGSGKTALARVLAHKTKSFFVSFSAVLGGLTELRRIIDAARERRAFEARSTTLFVDEIHHFNKSQQDAFLPHIEDGSITLMGATTENPSFSVNAALLSRVKVFRLEPLDEASLVVLLERAIADRERGLGAREIRALPATLQMIARASDGDARRALGLLEASAELLASGELELTVAHIQRAAEERTLLYDKSGEEHYNITSALIKSLRGSDPDAALYWLLRMLEAGDDPLFLLRRLMIFASEDVGNADPGALAMAVHSDSAFRRMGMPEGIFPIAHACLYLASCPKSNAVLKALDSARKAISQWGALPVPNKLRNPVTGLVREHGYGKDYHYPHEYEASYVPGETYLPDRLIGSRFYDPSDQGFERKIKERFEKLRALAEKKT
jgi:putative ATPase